MKMVDSWNSCGTVVILRFESHGGLTDLEISCIRSDSSNQLIDSDLL
jgi:hypothetical protein